MSAQKKWAAVCRQCGRVEIAQKTKPTSCKTVIKVSAASERRCGLPLVYSAGAAIPVSGGQPTGRGFHGWLERKGQASAEGRAPRQAAPLATTAPEKKRSAPFWIDASTVRIDKGVPIPGRGTKAIDWAPLLGQLAVGDSFLLPATAKSAIGTAMKAFKDSTGKTLASRKVDGGIRVWRIE